MSSPETDSPNFEAALAEVERSLLALKERYAQVQADQQKQDVLEEQLTQLQQEYRRTRSRSLRTELNRIKEELEKLELALESQLFSWEGLKDVFWMAVRFGGLGMIIGWLLKSVSG